MYLDSSKLGYQRSLVFMKSIKTCVSCSLTNFAFSIPEIAFFFPLRWSAIVWIISPFLTDPFPEMILCNSCFRDIYVKVIIFEQFHKPEPCLTSATRRINNKRTVKDPDLLLRGKIPVCLFFASFTQALSNAHRTFAGLFRLLRKPLEQLSLIWRDQARYAGFVFGTNRVKFRNTSYLHTC